jgi:hypothetical protein
MGADAEDEVEKRAENVTRADRAEDVARADRVDVGKRESE